MKKKPIGIFTSDIHYSERAPICRKEDDWFEYQASTMKWLGKLKKKLKCELFVVGDLFEKAKVSNELLNLTIDNMPPCNITIGNHDILYHSMELLDKSGLGSLTRYDKFVLLNEPLVIGDYEFIPFHFGQELKPYEGDKTGVALLHELIWENEPFPGADKKGNVKNIAKQLDGFKYAFVGDNHDKFITHVGDLTIVNHGSLMRLTAKQIEYQPSVCVLYDDGSVESIDVPCDKDKISREHLEVKEIKDERIKDFVESLKGGTLVHDLNFVENLKEYLASEKIGDSVVELLEEASDCNLK